MNNSKKDRRISFLHLQQRSPRDGRRRGEPRIPCSPVTELLPPERTWTGTDESRQWRVKGDNSLFTRMTCFDVKRFKQKDAGQDLWCKVEHEF